MDAVYGPQPLTEVIYAVKEKDLGRTVLKIRIEDHTYIYINNTWNSAGDNFVHDPGCQCLKEGE